MKIFARVAAAALTWLVSALPSMAQVTNGSLTGPIVNAGVPPGWSVLAETPDTMDENNNVGVLGYLDFGAPASPSPDGGTWVGLGRDVAFLERFGQTIGGLVAGNQYTVSWFASNFGVQTLGYVQPNAFEVLIDGGSIGSGAVLALGPGWFAQSLNFTATAASHALAFELDADVRSYMGIDGIAVDAVVSAVPEPATIVLVGAGLAVIGSAARRTRRRS